MDRATEIALLEELHGLAEANLFYLDSQVTTSPVARYQADRFAAEQDQIFRCLPVIAAHSTELAAPDSFVTRRAAGRPVLLTRDSAGVARAFLNVCRHRGAKLVEAEAGCRRAFSCPYHGWTYANTGALRGIPHGAAGFPGVDKAAVGLKQLLCLERFGMIWIVADPASDLDIADWLDPLAADFEWMGMADHVIACSDVSERAANWKLLAEGGIEAYHFKVAHKSTIGPHFLDNLSSYRMLGPHMRSVLPRNSLRDITSQPQEDWAIRDHANVLYTAFPTSQFLVMQDHIAWIAAEPLTHDRTQLRISTLVPADQADRTDHWTRNHEITMVTLDEDFAINEATQAGIETGANSDLTFGRYEGALAAYNSVVEAQLSSSEAGYA